MMNNPTVKDYFGLTVYRAFGIESDEIRLSNYKSILIDPKENNQGGFISFECINNIALGLLTPIWSRVEFGNTEHFYDGIGAGYSIFSLKTGDVLELLKAHGLLDYFVITSFGLKQADIKKSILQAQRFGGTIPEIKD